VIPPLPTPNINSKASKSAQTKGLEFSHNLPGKGRDPKSILCGKEEGSKGQERKILRAKKKGAKARKFLLVPNSGTCKVVMIDVEEYVESC
jgi:hypothetical protein